MPGAFSGLPFPWPASSSLPSGQVAEAYAQQMRVAALSMMQASRGPQEEQSSYLGEMAAAQQHLAAMFQQGYNSYMMGSMVRPAAVCGSVSASELAAMFQQGLDSYMTGFRGETCCAAWPHIHITRVTSAAEGQKSLSGLATLLAGPVCTDT